MCNIEIFSLLRPVCEVNLVLYQPLPLVVGKRTSINIGNIEECHSHNQSQVILQHIWQHFNIRKSFFSFNFILGPFSFCSYECQEEREQVRCYRYLSRSICNIPAVQYTSSKVSNTRYLYSGKAVNIVVYVYSAYTERVSRA